LDRRSRNLIAVVLVAIIALTGGAALVLGPGDRLPSNIANDATPVVGVIVGVDSQGLDRVTGFRLRTIDQGTLEFEIGALENGTAFPPGHLVEHQASGSQVRVWYRIDGGVKVAVRLEDAP
jgi:hypothetical protein